MPPLRQMRMRFQSTKPQRLRHTSKGFVDGIKQFQSTKPQRLRLIALVRALERIEISIHEAAKASTEEFATITARLINFNPRSRKGFDGLQGRVAAGEEISIHEAAKASTGDTGATGPQGAFQSTKPQRLRPGYFSFCLIHHDFNPRSRKGFDIFAESPFRGGIYFNPRSRKGFDVILRVSKTHVVNFNPRSRKGFDGRATMPITGFSKFQSTKPQRLRQQKHPKNNLIFKNNLYTYYNIPTHNNYILIIFNLFTIKSTIFQVRISRDFHVHFLFAPNNSIIKYHH